MKRFDTRRTLQHLALFLTVALISTGWLAQAGHAQSAMDDVSNTAYDDGWQTGDNGGTGFNAWTLNTTSGDASQNGHFIGSSTANGNGDTNSDGDINTADGDAWGMFANSGALSEAFRPFSEALSTNDSLTLDMDNGFVDNSSTVGFGLQNSSGENLVELFFVGGDNNYTVNDGDPNNKDTGVAFTDEGLDVTFTLTGASTYFLTLTDKSDAANTGTVTGTLMSPGGGQDVSQIRLFNADAGNGASNNLYFNSFEITEAPPSMPSGLNGFTIPTNADQDGSMTTDTLYRVDTTGAIQQIGPTDGAGVIEAMDFRPTDDSVYVSNGDRLGTVDTTNGDYMPKPMTYGTGMNGESSPRNFDDVDGLAFDPRADQMSVPDTLYGLEREAGNPDALFQIDPNTGSFVPGAFADNDGDGTPDDYVLLPTVDGGNDYDAISIIEESGTMYAFVNDAASGGTLVKLNKDTGAVTENVGVLGADNLEGSSFDSTGTLYAVQGQGDGSGGPGNALFRVDTTDGSATKVMEFPEGNDYEAISFNQTSPSTAPLPVELTAFTAAQNGEAVQLSWQTASETNNARFEIQRNAGNGWREVGRREGAGTTAEAHRYAFTDDALPFTAQTVRYRLRQVNRDGAATLSDERSVTLGAPQQFTLEGAGPNPFRRNTTIRYALPDAAEVTVAIYDVLGRRVATLVDGEQQEAGPKAVRLEAADLPAGMYLVRVRAGEHVATGRMVHVQ